ncbi:nucleoprotein [odonatan chu-related virus 137]|uniref:nucleoprotein n=1 Tax=odonatan chu-related virus 137 TaxID=2848006 RepID=UPI002481B65E|nr:nucleoprotein [odonatan chu-related virus 137]UOW66033.1 nucleoprotein [odonatan chu-related virus 137]
MPNSDSETESVRSTGSSSTKRGKTQSGVSSKKTRANRGKNPPHNPPPQPIPGPSPAPRLTFQPVSMDIDNPSLPGPSRPYTRPPHPLLAPHVRTPRYEVINDLANRPGSGFHTSPSFSHELFLELVSPNLMYRGFILTNTTAHFPKKMYQTGAYLAGAVISIGFARLKMPAFAIIDEIKLRIIGEVTAMNLPNDLLLEPNDADDAFLEIMNFIMHSDPTVFRGSLEFTSEGYMNTCGDERSLDLFPLSPQFKAEVPWAPDRVLTREYIGDATRICLWLTTTLSNAYKGCRTELSFSYLIAMCRRGSATSQFLTRAADDINTELGKNVAFDEDLIRRIYRIYGLYINENNAESVFATLMFWIPDEGLRLKLIVQHTQSAGLTPHYTVKEALLKYPDFPWGKFDKLVGGEIRGFIRAWSMIRGNQYYGFKRDLKEASSQSFKSLAYVAKELLIQVGGQNGLRAYRGWTRTPAVKVQLDGLIVDYIGQLTGADAVLSDEIRAQLAVIAGSTSATPDNEWDRLNQHNQRAEPGNVDGHHHIG